MGAQGVPAVMEAIVEAGLWHCMWIIWGVACANGCSKDGWIDSLAMFRQASLSGILLE